MHLHSLPTVTQFCEAGTHDRESPNKQNTFCQQESAWDTIRKSPEFNTGEELDGPMPPMVRKVVKYTSRPLFYLLLDGGRTVVRIG
jgi:hypothetical protein